MASLSVEEENYVRMSLLLTGISQRAVRTFFDSEFPPACLEATMKKEYNKLLDLKRKRLINQSQWNLLFPRFSEFKKLNSTMTKLDREFQHLLSDISDKFIIDDIQKMVYMLRAEKIPAQDLETAKTGENIFHLMTKHGLLSKTKTQMLIDILKKMCLQPIVDMLEEFKSKHEDELKQLEEAVPDSKTFDVTLMTTLLRNLTPMNPPLGKFERLPSAMATSPASDLARIKYYRSFLVHLDHGKLDTTDMTTAWTDMTGAIYRLGGTQMKQECDYLKTKPLDQTNQKVMTDIKQSNDEILVLKESLKLLQEDLRKVTKEMEILKSTQYDIVPRNIKAQINHLLEEWRDNDKMFILTRAAKHVMKCIKENGCVTITASSGVGKTAILQHVALQMADEGYDVLPVTNPGDIVKLYNPNQKTLFVIDDLCGNYSLNQTDLKVWEPLMERIKKILSNKLAKIIVACRLQVYQDDKFEALSVFKSCVCNLLSDNMCLSKTEKQSIAKFYLKTNASAITGYYDLYDCFPLLCKLYHENPSLNIRDFFQNPFTVYEAEIDKLYQKGYHAKYCALALCVMFGNKLKEEIFTEEMNEETRAIFENTFEACRLDRGTSRLVLQDELNSLTNTFIKKEQDIYKILHNKLFDFLAYYYGKKIIGCLIRNADSGFIKERFTLERNDDMYQFIIIVPTQYHQMYIQRMIDDWSNGKLQDVFSNINMKIPQFRQKFLCYLEMLDMSHQRQLAHTCDVYYKDTALIQCCLIGDIPLIQWCISQGVDINQSRFDGLTPLFAAKGHTEVVKLLLDKKAAIFDLRNKWSKDERIPTEIRNMEQRSVDIYLSALQFGSEKKKNINLKIVGKKGAGKTSLVCRLLGEEFTKVDSTNGIDIHRRKFKIKSDPWTKMAELKNKLQ